MKGGEWIEVLKKKQIYQLIALHKAITILSEDVDVKREYSELGLFDGFPSLKGLIGRTLREKAIVSYQLENGEEVKL